MFRRLSIVAGSLLLLASPLKAINIAFDYSYDANGFFTSNATAKVDLEAAGQYLGSLLTDSLTAISPSGSNTWSATFANPATGNSTTVSGLDIAANTILIFVGGSTLGGSTLGEGGPGGWSASGNNAWLNTVNARGQAGALSATETDFGPWGGAITFNQSASWYFDTNPATKESFSANDFYSVALHELSHVLGIGTAGSWNTYVSGSTFTGTNSKAANGGLAVSLSGDLAHWANGTMSTIYGTSTAQEAAMDPSLTTGTRKLMTTLDVAGLKDVGWTISTAAVPEPSSMALICGFALVAFSRRKRSQR